ncbi:MAG: hypothetical protein NC411_06840 [Bacteroides sp.]|nr:hypothetical protein [Bacteroides sp.]
MLISLSPSAIVDIIHAYAALELLSVNDDDESRLLLAPLLDREHPEPLRLLVENSFAETILTLIPYVDDIDMPTECDEASGERLLQLNLRIPDSFSPSLITLMRRRLELVVAMNVLASALTVSSSATPALATVFSEHHNQALTSLLSLLRTPSRPFVRRPF